MQNKQPRFSVIIPTRNRSDWVESAIRSALEQSCEDLEVLVVDNSTPGDNSTQDVVEKFQDGRLRYLRTGGLGMAANWQQGLNNALGEYISVCSDKLVLQPWILDTADSLIREFSVDAVVWKIGAEDAVTPVCPEKISHYSTKGSDVFNAAASGGWNLFFNAGPRGMNSVFKASFVKKTQEKFNVPLCRMICPDYNIALSLSSFDISIRAINHVGSAFISNAHGNAMLCILNNDKKTIRSQFEVPELDSLPTKYLTAVNHIYYDIQKMNEMLPEAEQRTINWEMYFVNLIHEAVNISEFQKLDKARKSELLSAIRNRKLKFRLSLLKTIVVQEFHNLFSGRRKLSFQIWRMTELIKYPLRCVF